MKKSFIVATILVVVVSMFIGCVLPIGSPGGTGESGETAGYTSESSTEDVAQDIATEDVTHEASTEDISQDIIRMLVVPEDARKVVDSAMNLFVGEDQWVNSFDLGLWEFVDEYGWDVSFYIETTKEPTDEQFHKMAEILKELGYPQEDIHLKFSEERKEMELRFSSERTGSVSRVYVYYIPEDLEINIVVWLYPSVSELGLDLDKGDKYDWSCVKDVANMFGINIENVLENVSYTASYEEEGYNDIGLSITNSKDQESPVFDLYVTGYMSQSRIENVVDKIEMLRDTHGGNYSTFAGYVKLEDARICNSSFEVYFSREDSSDEIKGVMLEMEIVVK